MKRLGLALILLLGSFGAVAADNGDPRTWLSDMNRAFTDLSYDGTFSYFSGNDLASLRIVHMVVDGEQRERLVHLNGALREIIRTGEKVSCILMPGDELLDLTDSIPSGPFARAFVRRYDQISEYYGLAFYGEGRVADRPAVRLSVSPRDHDRYGYRLWLDKRTRLLLRSELIDLEGGRLEIFQFTQILFGDEVDSADLEPTSRAGTVQDHFELASKEAEPIPMSDMPWRLTWLPKGFTMAAADIRRTPSESKSIHTMMYSDGLAAFSVFIEDMPQAGAASMVSRTGATVAVTHLVAGPNRAHHLVTLVGELPTPTALKIAKSIRYRGI